jgi:hypothetical protein
MSSLSPRLQIRVQQKQILTPGLVQMVSLLQLNRLELKDMITAEIAEQTRRNEQKWGASGLGATHVDAGLAPFPDAAQNIWYSANRTIPNVSLPQYVSNASSSTFRRSAGVAGSIISK